MNDAMGHLRMGQVSAETGDHAVAVEHFRLSAEGGCATGLWRLGQCYDEGEGVPEDLAKAVHFYRLSAEQDDPIGLFKLGYAYEHAIEVPMDLEEAARLYQRSAEQGDEEALEALRRLKPGVVLGTRLTDTR